MNRRSRLHEDPALDDRVSANPWALEVSRLCFAYPDGPEVLSELDLHVAQGERVGVIGPNGAGKTTFFLIACGILQPDAGAVRTFGRSVPTARGELDLNMVFQNPDDQLLATSVWQDVAFGPQNLGLPPREVAARVAQALERTGTQELAERAPHHLSGGEKRMVSIAGVLALHPRVVIYDEPSASLDLRSRRRLIGFLREAGHSLLIASHDLELVLEVCDRVVVVNDGQAVAGGEPRVVMGQAELMEANGLETPPSLRSA